MRIFEAQHIFAGYKSNVVLHDVSLAVEEGDFLAIIGPNGSGKSTLIKVFAGNLNCASGDLNFKGRSLAAYNERELALQFSVVHQFKENMLSFPVYDFIMLGRFPYQRVLKYSDHRDRDAVETAMAMAGVGHLRTKAVTELSGGELQLVSIAAALAQNSRVILLDEPVSNLDINHTMKIMDILQDLNQSGATVVVVLHDINLAASYCGRIAGLKEGRVFFDDRPEKVITYESIESLYDTICVVGTNPLTGKPHVYPVPGFLMGKV